MSDDQQHAEALEREIRFAIRRNRSEFGTSKRMVIATLDCLRHEFLCEETLTSVRPEEDESGIWGDDT